MTTRTQEVASTSAPLVEDQIRSYRRNQRRLFNTRQAARQMGQRIFGSPSTRNILEQQIDPQVQLRLSMRERAAIAPAEVLYHSRRDDAHHRPLSSNLEEGTPIEFQGGRSPKEINPKLRICKGFNTSPLYPSISQDV
ncbi:hypothetical protein C4D60_Mb06t22690 [Musa balbisiana]|uniref:Uncharacterized protein n=1 Tax=Musa balbisiana TaxID=52838 RepID=A0A4S8IQ23_MUSBA|nr:hypothetical protein C4D60_Mb06t22690 [Musa balbisiana]